MKRIKSSTQNKNNAEAGALGQTVFTAIDGKPVFVPVQTQATALGAAATDLTTADNAYQTALQEAQQKLLDRQSARVVLDGLLAQVGAGVENIAAGDLSILLQSGFPLRATPAPIGHIPAPLGLECTTNGTPGRGILRWNRRRGSRSYEVQTSPDPITPTGWKAAATPTSARVVLEGLPSVTRVWFRVRGIGAAGPGDWSDAIAKTVP